jgi:prefoldin beta subunit
MAKESKEFDASKIQEMQILEQNLQNLLLQKQAFQMELSETEAALEEIKKSGDKVYKVVGQLMIQTEKDKIKKELEEKKKIIDTRLKSIEKQEGIFSEKIESLRQEFMKFSEEK